MIAFLYPGQGSQHAGMGAAWRQHDSWELVVEASDATGRDVGHLLLEVQATTNCVRPVTPNSPLL